METDLTIDSLLEGTPPPREATTGKCFRLEAALESQWIGAARDGDQRAFGKLVESHQDRIFSLCLRLLGCREDAAEACQDVFVRAFDALPKYQPEARFSTWLYRIAVNRCHDFWKRASSRLKALTTTLSGRELTLKTPGPTPDHHADWQDSLKQLDRALQALPARDREILILSGVENLSHSECATILGTSERGIEGRLYRAREKLRKTWDPSFSGQ